MADTSPVPVISPSPAAILANLEKNKGLPLPEKGIPFIADPPPAVLLARARIRRLEETRGYRDLDPVGSWREWQDLRETLARS